jgi:hypothetical protein
MLNHNHRPTVDGNSPVERSRKATRINMSTKHRFGTEYGIDSVMLGTRGKESHGQHGTMNGRSQLAPAESPKKSTAGERTPFGGSVGQ